MVARDIKNQKRILIIATGGTIASAIHVETGALSPALSAHEIAERVPELRRLCHYELVQLMNIDSTDMRPCHWLSMVACIKEHYQDFDGFVILHGTDTLAYSAAALSYLIQQSAKPIVLTGAQQPITNSLGDAARNLYQAVLYACDDKSHEVSVVFGGAVIFGTRAHKQKTMSFNAFTSLNIPEQALIRNDQIYRLHPESTVAEHPQFYTKLNDRVLVLKLTPELKPSIFKLIQDDYDAVILETFGIGGIPSYEGLYQQALDEWLASGHSLIITTQVPEEGLNLDVYSVGAHWAKNPQVLKGADMTTEALVAKTMWALGQSQDPQELQNLFYTRINADRLL